MKNKNGLIRISNFLNEGYYKLDLHAQKMVCVFLTLINMPKREKNGYYSITMRELCMLVAIENSKDYRVDIRAAIQKLLKGDALMLPDGTITNWIASAKFMPTGEIHFEFSRRLIPQLFELTEKFTKYSLVNISPMKRSRSIRLYQLVKQHAYKKYWQVDLPELRRHLEVNEDAYPFFKDFMNRCVKPCVAEINECTDLKIYAKPKRGASGRAYQYIYFEIYPKADGAPVEDIRDTIKRLNESYKHENEAAKRELSGVNRKELNSPNFNLIYGNFITHSKNFPPDYHFSEYVRDMGGAVVTLPNGGKDVILQTKIEKV